MKISEINPFVRTAMIQPAVLEGKEPRLAFDFRLFLILEGKGLFYIQDKVMQIEENHLLLVPPETEYYFKGKIKVAVINFDMTRKFKNETHPLTPVSRNQFKRELLFDTQAPDGFESFCSFLASPKQKSELLELTRIFISKDEFWDALCSSKLKLFLSELLAEHNKKTSFKSDLIGRIMFYIKSNAAEIRSNKSVGKALGYHPNYISALLKEEMGKTLHEVVLEEKISLSCRWLKASGESIENIAFAVGFSSRNHFCTAFKKIIGTSPLQFRLKK